MSFIKANFCKQKSFTVLMKNYNYFILEITTLKYIAYRAENDTKVLWSFIRSQRGAPFLVHSGYVYRCERKIASKTYWLCLQYKRTKCNGRMIFDGNTIIKSTEHNHSTDSKANYSNNIEYKSLEDDDIENWIKSK